WQEGRRDLGLSRSQPQPPRARREKFPPYVLRGCRHTGSRRQQVGPRKLRTLDAWARRGGHILPHRVGSCGRRAGARLELALPPPQVSKKVAVYGRRWGCRFTTTPL